MLADSNILVYSLNDDSSKQSLAQKFLQENQDNLEIAHQNIFETLRILTHPKLSARMNPIEAIQAMKDILLGYRVISPNDQTYRITLALMNKYNLASDMIFDAYLVATALSNGIDTIATDNVRDFKQFIEIKVINPFS